ncbi:FAD-dependent oxidoreductase [Amycolatopsis pithecellobii]|uniref:FAD-dependent oxidoreductase n=1 Tax=Amycolatopsis pithecellobii TaxID=664692 RepID=A0A6N7Z3C4_9PSEU|nr:FAD-dependent oxidoreductase [Amycolatopsis pithecellobii]MTD53396.1 FAD-dependent oxidoreductase [Amycolatopsis pithecellobii]
MAVPDRDVDVVVAGAGPAGCAAAWRMASRGADVLVLDDAAPGADDTAVFRVAHADMTDVFLALQALSLWRELEQGTGTRLLRLTGEIAHGRGAELDLLAWAADLAGKPGRWLPAGEAVERWPGIRYEERIFFHPLAGCLDADAAVTALRTAAAAEGAAVRSGSVTAVEYGRADAVLVHTSEGCYRARRAVVAASAPVRTATCVRFAPVRGGLAWPVFAHYDTTGLIAAGAPAGDGVSARAGDDPARYARCWLPGADPAAGQRYRTETGTRFVLDRRGPVVRAAGFTGEGFKFLPAVGRMIADLVLTGAVQKS